LKTILKVCSSKATLQSFSDQIAQCVYSPALIDGQAAT